MRADLDAGRGGEPAQHRPVHHVARGQSRRVHAVARGECCQQPVARLGRGGNHHLGEALEGALLGRGVAGRQQRFRGQRQAQRRLARDDLIERVPPQGRAAIDQAGRKDMAEAVDDVRIAIGVAQ